MHLVKHQDADTLAEVLDEPILVTLGHERCISILEDIRTDTAQYTLDGFRVWLRSIPTWLRKDAIAALKKGNVKDFIGTVVDFRHSLTVVACNIPFLQHRGLYEAALLRAFISSATNRLRDPLPFQRSLFMLADRQKLRDAGDSLPGAAPYALYRGVAGVGALRRGRGLAWTESFEKAAEFAMMWNLPDPAVFEAIVSDEEILTYTHSEMKDHEYIVMLSRQTPVRKCEDFFPYIEWYTQPWLGI